MYLYHPNLVTLTIGLSIYSRINGSSIVVMMSCSGTPRVHDWMRKLTRDHRFLESRCSKGSSKSIKSTSEKFLHNNICVNIKSAVFSPPLSWGNLNGKWYPNLARARWEIISLQSGFREVTTLLSRSALPPWLFWDSQQWYCGKPDSCAISLAR